jgi:hypothetical protein
MTRRLATTVIVAVAVAGCAIAPREQARQVASLLDVTPRQGQTIAQRDADWNTCIEDVGSRRFRMDGWALLGGQLGVAFSQKAELQSCMATKGYDVRSR